ncbi:MAG: hypothetical protein AAF333_03290 [Planctomycetota bacterium]
MNPSPPDSPMRGDVQEQVRAYYAGQTLRPEKLDAVLADLPSGTAALAPRRRTFSSAWAVAASVALVLVVGGLWTLRPSADASPTSLVAREIALNHTKALTPDHPAERFEQLASMRDKLGFAPVEPAGLAERGLRLAGARYCSVQGCMAAQVSVVDERGEAWTLYQVRPDERLATLDEVSIAVDGVDVELWREAGLVMGLARTR